MPTLDYEIQKDRARQRAARISAAGRDIGSIPPVVNSKRKAECRRSFRKFCEQYFPDIFDLAWSKDHLDVIKYIETAVLEGDLLAVAMPRASGKSTLCEAAVMWANLYGHRNYVFLIGAANLPAIEMLENIKIQLSENDLLLEDFPEACYPIRKLDNETRKAIGQTHHGRPTHITWAGDKISLPTIPGSRASGATVKVAGLTGNLRGAVVNTHDGRRIRPDFVIIDDPQTDESAHSPSQCEKRERILSGAVLGLAGPGKSIAGIMPCTVIRQGDMADNILDPKKYPEWKGRRTKLIYKWPENQKLWDQYEIIRRDEGKDASTEFYQANRKAMDKGAEVAWPERKEPNEISAIQNAVNLKIRHGGRAFNAEYQNEPLSEDHGDRLVMDSDSICEKQSMLKRAVVPLETTHITSFIDVQLRCLWWMTVAWSDGFGGQILDYGTWPDQNQNYVTLSQVKKTIARAKPGAGFEAQLIHALETCTQKIMATKYKREDGTKMGVSRMMIDAGWGESTRLVEMYARQSDYSSQILPSFGRGITAKRQPISEYKRRPGERKGVEWIIRPSQSDKQPHIMFDTNYWKTFVHKRLNLASNDYGSIHLYKASPSTHRMLGDHLAAERPTMSTSNGRTVQEFDPIPGRDNHLLDCLVGCAVGASEQGIKALGHEDRPAPQRKKYKRRKTQGQAG